MEVWDGLAPIRAIINDETETGVVEALQLGNVLGNVDQMAEQRFVGDLGFGHARDFLLGDDQDMDRRLGIDVVEGQAEVVLEGDLGRDLAGDDSGEDGAHGFLRVTRLRGLGKGAS